MTERGILFSAPMVRAIIAGRKTMTRRVVNLRGYDIDERELENGSVVPWPFYYGWAHGDADDGWMACPFGEPGDLLWVRETFFQRNQGGDVEYAAACGTGLLGDLEDSREWRKRPSIYMPRWASRINLRVTGVKVERLQEITEEDCFAEGVRQFCVHDEDAFTFGGDAQIWNEDPDETLYTSARSAFEAGWDSINSNRPGCAWADNPWVWVVSFERVTP